MKKSYKILSVILLFSLLVLIRGFATVIFYDPLNIYFYNDYLYAELPEINKIKLLFSMVLRYSLNTVISLLIIQVLFDKKNYTKFSIYFYGIALVILVITFFYFLNNKFNVGYLLPFYIRRFIIHPIFLLLLLPAFYYQKINSQ